MNNKLFLSAIVLFSFVGLVIAEDNKKQTKPKGNWFYSYKDVKANNPESFGTKGKAGTYQEVIEQGDSNKLTVIVGNLQKVSIIKKGENLEEVWDYETTSTTIDKQVDRKELTTTPLSKGLIGLTAAAVAYYPVKWISKKIFAASHKEESVK